MQALGRGLKSPSDLAQLSRELLKITVEASLNAEMDAHLGYGKHAPDGYNTGNSRNGYNRKTLKGDHGEIEIATPRDRNGAFEPVFVEKNQTRLTKFDDQILLLYAKGMTTRDIVDTFAELYGADISPTLVSQVTNAVLDQVIEWQTRPLDAVYPILYLDCLVVKIRQDKRVINKAVYVALGVNSHGHKELLGLWMSENEGAKFWLSVLTELKNRGVKDVFIACVDGLTGFPDAIAAVFPKTQVQLCIVHMMRNSLAFVSWKDRQGRGRRAQGNLPVDYRRGSRAGAGSLCPAMGQAVSQYQCLLASALAQFNRLLRVSRCDSQSHLHHQCH